MNVLIGYNEVLSFLEREYNIKLESSVINNKTIELEYKINKYVPGVVFSFRVESVYNNILCISYGCGLTVNFVITGILNLLREKIPNGVKVENQQIWIDLNNIHQLGKILEHVSLVDVNFENTNVNVEFLIIK